jgi:hypothetical protein
VGEVQVKGFFVRETNGAVNPGPGAFTQLDATSGSVFRKNAIINGDFNIWQRGTSFAAVANGDYTADRWRYANTSAAVHTLSRSTDVPTVAQAGRLYNYSILVDCTTADAAVAAADIVAIQQRIEGYNWLPLAQREITLSFWVKATKTGTYCASIRNGAGDRSFVREFTVSTTATWEKKTLTFTASPSAGTWDYTTDVGLILDFVLMAGSNYQTTAGAWQTGNFLTTSSQVNACDSTSNDFRITGVQLEVGSVATEFEQRTIQEEFALCSWYYRQIEKDSNEYFPVAGKMISTTIATFPLHFPRMRAAPSFTFSVNTQFTIFAGTGTSAVSAASMSALDITAETCRLGATASGALTDGAVALLFANANDTLIALSAEL